MADLPPAIEAAFDLDDAQEVFDALMPALCAVLSADRCFLYLRDDSTRRGGTVASWSADERWPDMRRAFEPELDDLFTIDPMMGIAARNPEALFIADVETAGPEILNLEFERDFLHRALIHAPVYDEGGLIGILEPCTFGDPHPWTEADRSLTAAVQERLGPVAGAWLRAEPR
jgi:GAF domain-containing protein